MPTVEFTFDNEGFLMFGKCKLCLGTFNYVWFDCGCCNPDTFALCPAPCCKYPLGPTKKRCRKPTIKCE